MCPCKTRLWEPHIKSYAQAKNFVPVCVFVFLLPVTHLNYLMNIQVSFHSNLHKWVIFEWSNSTVKRDQITKISLKPAPPPPIALPWRNNILRVANRDRLQKLTVVHLAQKYPAFYGTRRFIIVSQEPPPPTSKTRSFQPPPPSPSCCLSILTSVPRSSKW